MSYHYTDQATASAAAKLWPLFSSVEAEALVNALRRWQASYQRSANRKTTNNDPFVRLVLDRCLPSEVEAQLCKEPLDRLMQNVIAVRTDVIDNLLSEWCAKEGITQVVILASGFDTRAWRLRWPPGVQLYEIDSAMIMNTKFTALGDIETSNCHRLALIGDVFNLPGVFQSLKGLGFKTDQPSVWLMEDVVEYMLPELASEMFEVIASRCIAGSRLICTLSDCRLRDLLKRYHHQALIEDYEPAGVVLNRISCAGWQCEMLLSGELESKFDVDLHGSLYIVTGKKL